MPRLRTLALAAAMLFALAGCAQLFEFNLFGALDSPPTPTAADYQGSDGLDRLAEDLGSPAMIDALNQSGIVDDIKLDLWDTYLDTPPLAAGEDLEAAILYADLALKTSEGEQLVNNIVQTIFEENIGSTTTVAEILAGIIPPEALASEATFTEMVSALLEANDAYLLLGAYVDGSTSDGVWENDLPPGSLPGDVALKAIVAYTMAMTVAAAIPVSIPATEAQAIAELYKVANGDPSPVTSVTPDPFDEAAPFNTPPGPDRGIMALADLAGMAL